jgi:hypothetical protein
LIDFSAHGCLLVSLVWFVGQPAGQMQPAISDPVPGSIKSHIRLFSNIRCGVPVQTASDQAAGYISKGLAGLNIFEPPAMTPAVS